MRSGHKCNKKKVVSVRKSLMTIWSFALYASAIRLHTDTVLHGKKFLVTITQNGSIFLVKNLGIHVENGKIFGWIVFAQVLFLGNVNPIFLGLIYPIL